MMDPIVPGGSFDNNNNNGGNPPRSAMRTPPRSRGGNSSFQGNNGGPMIGMASVRTPNANGGGNGINAFGAIDGPPHDYNYPQNGANVTPMAMNNNNNNMDFSSPPPQSGRISQAGGNMPPMGMLPPPTQYGQGPPSGGRAPGHYAQGSMSINNKPMAWTNSPVNNNGGNNGNVFEGVREEDLVETADPPPLTRHTPVWWLLASGGLLCIFAAADGFSFVALPMPQFGSDGDNFTMAGWIIHFVSALFLVITMIMVGVRKDPFSSAALMGYLFSLAGFVAAMILHTSRLIPEDVLSSGSSSSGSGSTTPSNITTMAEYLRPTFVLFSSDNSTDNGTTTTDSSDDIVLTWFGNNASIAVELQWIGCLVFYIFFSVMVWKAPRERPMVPTGDEIQKYNMLLAIRKLENRYKRKVKESIRNTRKGENMFANVLPPVNNGNNGMGNGSNGNSNVTTASGVHSTYGNGNMMNGNGGSRGQPGGGVPGYGPPQPQLPSITQSFYGNDNRPYSNYSNGNGNGNNGNGNGPDIMQIEHPPGSSAGYANNNMDQPGSAGYIR